MKRYLTHHTQVFIMMSITPRKFDTITHDSYIIKTQIGGLPRAYTNKDHLSWRPNHSISCHFYVTIFLSFQLDVTILYESLCPDSVAFFRDQLRPNYEYFKNFINVNLVPFGKSQVSWIFAHRDKSWSFLRCLVNERSSRGFVVDLEEGRQINKKNMNHICF